MKYLPKDKPSLVPPDETPNDNKIEIVDWEEEQAREKRSPWKTGRTLEEGKQAEFVTPEQVYKTMLKYKNLRDQALFAILYLTGARISEIVEYTKIRYGHKDKIYRNYKGTNRTKKVSVQDFKNIVYKGMKTGGVKPEDIQIDTLDNKEYLRIVIRNLKNRREKSKIIPVPLDKPLEKKFAEVIDTYWNGCILEEPMFNMGKRRAQQIISKSGWHPHFLRKLRLTHLAKYNNFSDQKLKMFAGWSDSRPSRHYIKLTWEDLARSM